MTDATCKTCPWYCAKHVLIIGDCRARAPRLVVSAQDDSSAVFPVVAADDWCGEHPDRQPHEYAEATLVTAGDDGPSTADMRRIVDALEKMAFFAGVKP